MIKICGITSREDVQMISAFQPDFLGVVCFKDSPRNVPLEEIPQLFRKGTRNVKKIAVVVNPTIAFLEEREQFFHGFQLCGEETEKFCKEVKRIFPKHILWKAFRVKTEKDLETISEYVSADAILLDAFSEKEYGGTGKNIPKNILQKAKNYIGRHQDFWIAGGVNAENAHEIQEISGCDGLDISSSLEESPGKKSKTKIESFFNVL